MLYCTGQLFDALLSRALCLHLPPQMLHACTICDQFIDLHVPIRSYAATKSQAALGMPVPLQEMEPWTCIQCSPILRWKRLL